MSDDRLLAALQRLGSEELPPASDRAIRRRLETAWTARARATAARGFGIRRFAPALASLVLVAALGTAALGASADSPLWDTRVALEDAAVALRQSTDDRIAYLLDLVQSRTEEAARQEAAGHPAAAAKARAASASAVAALGPDLPKVETPLSTPAPGTPPPTASPSAVTTPANSPSPSASPSASGVPAVQLPSSPPPTATPTPLRTATPTPVRTEPHTPSPTPTATRAPVTITGMVKDASGAPVTGACITTSATVPTSTTQCSVKTTNGSYGITTTSTTPGQSVTLYAYWMNTTGQLFSGSATGTITSPTTVMPTINLTLRK